MTHIYVTYSKMNDNTCMPTISKKLKYNARSNFNQETIGDYVVAF
jgi:hypothetical protein